MVNRDQNFCQNRTTISYTSFRRKAEEPQIHINIMDKHVGCANQREK